MPLKHRTPETWLRAVEGLLKAHREQQGAHPGAITFKLLLNHTGGEGPHVVLRFPPPDRRPGP